MLDLILIAIFACIIYAVIEFCFAVVVCYLLTIAATLFGIGLGTFGLIGAVMWCYGNKTFGRFLSGHLLRASVGCVFVGAGAAIVTGIGFTKNTPVVTQEPYFYFFKHDVTNYQESSTIWSQLFFAGLIASAFFLITWAAEYYFSPKVKP